MAVYGDTVDQEEGLYQKELLELQHHRYLPNKQVRGTGRRGERWRGKGREREREREREGRREEGGKRSNLKRCLTSSKADLKATT
jgi:hypothetical protein